MTEPSIPPALSKEEWATQAVRGGEFEIRDGAVVFYALDPYYSRRVESRHALAALCLHEQPFGFTAKDVAGLRYQALLCRADAARWRDNREDRLVTEAMRHGLAAQYDGASVWYENLADRISALLPPDHP